MKAFSSFASVVKEAANVAETTLVDNLTPSKDPPPPKGLTTDTATREELVAYIKRQVAERKRLETELNDLHDRSGGERAVYHPANDDDSIPRLQANIAELHAMYESEVRLRKDLEEAQRNDSNDEGSDRRLQTLQSALEQAQTSSRLSKARTEAEAVRLRETIITLEAKGQELEKSVANLRRDAVKFREAASKAEAEKLSAKRGLAAAERELGQAKAARLLEHESTQRTRREADESTPGNKEDKEDADASLLQEGISVLTEELDEGVLIKKGHDFRLEESEKKNAILTARYERLLEESATGKPARDIDSVPVVEQQALLEESATLKIEHQALLEESATLKIEHQALLEESATLKIEHQALLDESATLKIEHQALLEESATLKTEHQALLEESAARLESVAKLTAEVADLQIQNEGSGSQGGAGALQSRSQLVVRLSLAEAARDDALKELEELRNSDVGANSGLHEVASENAEQHCAALQIELAEVKLSLSAEQERAAGAAAENARLQAEVAAHVDCEQQRSLLEAQMSRGEDTCSELQDENSKLAALYETLASEHQELLHEREVLAEQKQQDETSSSQLEEQLKRAYVDLQEAQDALTASEKEFAAYKERARAALSEANQPQRETSDSAARAAELAAEYAVCTERLECLQKELYEKTEEADKLNRSIAALRAENTELTATMVQQRSEYLEKCDELMEKESFERRAQEAEAEVPVLRAEVNSLRLAAEAVAVELSAAKERATELEYTLKDLRQLSTSRGRSQTPDIPVGSKDVDSHQDVASPISTGLNEETTMVAEPPMRPMQTQLSILEDSLGLGVAREETHSPNVYDEEEVSADLSDKLLYFAQVQAHRDEEISSLRAKLRVANEQISEAEKTTLLHQQQAEVLKEELSRLERNDKREKQFNLEYVKNIVLAMLTNTPLEAERLIPVLTKCLELSPAEAAKVKANLQAKGAPSLGSLFSWS